jgi:tetratricopeptide (TPR) repeat protein
VTFQALILGARCGLAAWTGRRMPIGLVGLGFAALALWTAISGAIVVLGETGDRRAAITMSVQWIGYASFLVAGIGLVREATFRRYAIVMIGSAAAAWGAMGAYDYYVRMPSIANDYFSLPEDDKREVLAANMEGNADDADERKRFEDRLRSVEPITTFSLTNTLAGFLLPGWIFAAYGTLRQAFDRRDFRRFVAWALIWLLVSFVLFLTKSRTAWAAAALGGAALALLFLARERRLPWNTLTAAAIGVALLGSVAWATGAVDREVFTEAAKSFAYRVEYWRSTAAMIAERPAFGTGPGNFGAYYLHEKLPQASEEVKDPHQWLLEIAATVGLPGAAAPLLAFAVAFVAGIRSWFRRTESVGRNPETSTERGESLFERRPFALYDFGVAGGAIVGYLLSILFLIPLDVPMATVGLIAFVLARWALARERAEASETSGVGAMTVATLLLNLSASGGVSYPGILPWLALATALATAGTALRFGLGRRSAVALSLGSALFAALTQFWAVPPVLPTGPALTASAEAAESLRDQFVPQAEREALQALALDPHLANVREFPPPAHTLIDARWLKFLADPDGDREKRFLLATEEAIRRDPASYSPYRFAGQRLLLAAHATQQKELYELAVTRYAQAVERYPNASWMHAQLAVALDAAGRPDEALKEVEEAERLDALNPHDDRRLDRQRLVDPTAPARETAAGEWIARFRSQQAKGQ